MQSNCFCSRKCVGKYKTENVAPIKLNCSYCGNEYAASYGAIWRRKKGVSKNNFCSIECHARFNSHTGSYNKEKYLKCSNCGNGYNANGSTFSMKQRGKQTIVYCSPKCRAEYFYKPEAHKMVCRDCGYFEIKKRRVPVNLRAGGEWQCKKCRPKSMSGNYNKLTYIKYLNCRKCGNDFIFKYVRKHCNSCRDLIFNNKGKCSKCGVELTEANRKHSHKTHKTCDSCEYVRRSAYKDRARYGDSAVEAMKKIRLVKNVSELGLMEMGFDTHWRGKKRHLKKIVELQLTTNKGEA